MSEPVDSQTVLELILTWSQIAANAAVLGGMAAIYFVYKQVRLAERALIGQNTMSLIEYLQQEETRQARRYILQNKNDDMFEKNAADVISSYDVAGILIRNGYIDKEIIVDNYGPSIKNCFERTDAFRKAVRVDKGARYWNDFEWLYGEVLEFDRRMQG